MLRTLGLVIVVVMALVPMAASAESIFIPQAHNSARDWFTTADVVAWIMETNNVMPVSCNAFGVNAAGEPLFHECTVVQAQPLELVWDNALGKVVAK